MNNNDEWFIIKDFSGFVESARALVFNSFSTKDKEETDELMLSVDSKDKEELDTILSYDESVIIIKEFAKKQKNKTSSKIRYLINDETFAKIIYSLNDRMVSNMLNNLVNKGLVETAYDSESDDFVFWIKDDVKNKIQTPETD